MPDNEEVKEVADVIDEPSTADPPATPPDPESQEEIDDWRQDATAWMSSIDRRIDGLVEKIDALIGASTPPAIEEKTEIEPAPEVEEESVTKTKRYAGAWF